MQLNKGMIKFANKSLIGWWTKIKWDYFKIDPIIIQKNTHSHAPLKWSTHLPHFTDNTLPLSSKQMPPLPFHSKLYCRNCCLGPSIVPASHSNWFLPFHFTFPKCTWHTTFSFICESACMYLVGTWISSMCLQILS